MCFLGTGSLNSIVRQDCSRIMKPLYNTGRSVRLCGLCGHCCETGPKWSESLLKETTMTVFRKCQLSSGFQRQASLPRCWHWTLRNTGDRNVHNTAITPPSPSQTLLLLLSLGMEVMTTSPRWWLVIYLLSEKKFTDSPWFVLSP